jgi:hypothetical protein
MSTPIVNRERLLALIITGVILSAALSAGYAAQKVTGKTLKESIAKAETAADHQAIAQYFDAEAARYEAEAKEHGELAAVYQKNAPSQPTKYPGSMQTFGHCDALAKSLQQAAKQARRLAADHREMAKEAK